MSSLGRARWQRLIEQERSMHRGQLEIRTELARSLIYDQFPRFRNEEIVALEGVGTTNAIFRIGTSHAARFPLTEMQAAESKSLLQAEVAAMAELSRCCQPVLTPQPIGIGEPGAGYPMPWLVQAWIEGPTATPDGLSGSTAFALDLARLIGTLRKADLRGQRFDGRGRGGNLPDHDAWMEVCLSNSEHLLDAARLRRLWSGFRRLPSAGPEVMSHKDLIPANLVVRGESIAGILDGGGFGPADPALDLVAGWHLLDRDRRGIFRDALQAGDLEWQRGAAWAFQQAMGLVWYYEETTSHMSTLGRSTIGRLLADIDG